MKTCVFINLPAATTRRAGVEASFAAAPTGDWALQRFVALGPNDVLDIPGSISPTEKACFASHRAALAETLGDQDHLMIVEDDAVFSPQTFTVIDGLLDAFPKWDVIYLDLSIGDFGLLAVMASRRDAMVAEGRYDILDLAKVSHAAMSAYVVRGSAKRKVHAELNAAVELDTPVDLYLRDSGHAGHIASGGVFPFLTTISSQAEISQIQVVGSAVFDPSMNAFRRLMFVARDDEGIRAEVGRLVELNTNETLQLMAPILANLVIAATK
jgi:GR25 family glycosyltransferase involved in LPS biosynthesis